MDHGEDEWQEAQHGREHLVETLDSLPDLLFDIDLDGVFHDARSGNPELFHVPPEAHIGARVEDILPPGVAVMWRGALQEAHTRGQVRGLEYTLELEEGTRWFELSVSRKNGAHHDPPRFIVAARDISERKSAEAARVQKEAELKRALAARDAAESRFYEIASVSHDWFWEQDAEGRFTYMSESVSQIPGRAPEFYIGRTREEVAELIGDGGNVDWSFVDECIAERKPFQDFIYPQVVDGGHTVWVRSSGAPFYDEDGRYAGYRGVGSDVTSLLERAKKKSHIATRDDKEQPTATMRAIAENRQGLWYQLDMLERLAREDRQRIVGWNAADEVEFDVRGRALEQNERMLAAIDAIRKLLPTSGAPSKEAADEIRGWADALVAAFRDCNAELKKYVARDWNKRAPLAARIMAGCSIAGVVTLIGMPTLATVVGGVVIGGQTVADVARSWRGKGPE